MRELTVGVVLPRSGRLRELSDPVAFVVELLRDRLHAGGRPVTFAVEDSCSDPLGARAAVERLARRGVSLVMTLGGTHVLPAVAAACEEMSVPCVSTTLPWQVYQTCRVVTEPRWSFHFCWGLDDIATVFAGMWGPQATVGCLWNDGVQGRALRDPANGFVPAALAQGHRLVDPGGYAEPCADFGRLVELLVGVDVVTASSTPEDLAAFTAQAARRGLGPRVITCSRWLSYPFGAERAGLDGIGTIVAWSPLHPHRSSVDGRSAADLAAEYEIRTGRTWPQPLGLAYALVEVAVHALNAAADPDDRQAVADAVREAEVDTICGTLDWANGPAPGIARLPLTGGWWCREGGRMALRVTAELPTGHLDRLTPF